MTLLLSPLLLATGGLSRTMMYNDEQSINSGDEISSKNKFMPSPHAVSYWRPQQED